MRVMRALVGVGVGVCGRAQEGASRHHCWRRACVLPPPPLIISHMPATVNTTTLPPDTVTHGHTQSQSHSHKLWLPLHQQPAAVPREDRERLRPHGHLASQGQLRTKHLGRALQQLVTGVCVRVCVQACRECAVLQRAGAHTRPRSARGLVQPRARARRSRCVLAPAHSP
jgi:hypothetical protein